VLFPTVETVGCGFSVCFIVICISTIAQDFNRWKCIFEHFYLNDPTVETVGYGFLLLSLLFLFAFLLSPTVSTEGNLLLRIFL
jgi:hypothetical protein